MNDKGLYEKYTVIDNDTQELVENVFVLEPDKDIFAQMCIIYYADRVKYSKPKLAQNLRTWMFRYLNHD